MNKRKRKPKAVIVDYDDTVVDFLGFLCSLHNKLYGTSLSENDIESWAFEGLDLKDVRGNSVTGAELNETFKKYEEHGMYALLPIIKDARFALKLMHDLGYKIIIITAREEKFQEATLLNLIHNDIYYDEIYFTDNKTKKIKELSREYNVALFADDKFDTVEDVSENCKVKQVFLINKKHNENIDTGEDVIRVRTLFEVVRHLKEAN